MDRNECELTDETIRETDRCWEDPRKIMNLIDLLFLWEDEDRQRIMS